MNGQQDKKKDVIDLRQLLRSLKTKRRLFYKILPVVFVVSCLIIVSVPRYYTCDVMLAPELSNLSGGGTLGSLASSFGIDIGSATTSDAISPTLYPDLIGSKDFIVTLFPVMVRTADGTVKTTYYEYMEKHQKTAWWNYPKMWLAEWIGSLRTPEDLPVTDGEEGQASPIFMMSKKENDIVNAMMAGITCSVDKKTDVITIGVKDQDKLVCATMADSVRARLQTFITNYRTNKARVDLEYYEKLASEALHDYEQARALYTRTADANMEVVTASARAKIEDLENDMQLKYNTYSVLNTQLQAAKAKVQERTPAFTILQGASVPLKPAGPKRMLFVLGMLLLATMGIVIYVLKDEIL
jgi:capsular polysaccharide biosynthesis protein